MADLRWHAVFGSRPIAGWCGNVCTSAFFLQHAVRVNNAGKGVLVIFGLGVHWYPPANSMLRNVALLNAVLMLMGQFWYTAFCGSPSAIAAFVAPDSRHGGTPRQQHVLHAFGVCPNVMLVAAVGYYSMFATLFAYSASLEREGSATLAYALAACFWHVWLAATLGWSATLGGLCNRTTNATASELQKLIGTTRSATADLPLAMETAFAVTPQKALSVVAPQVQGQRRLFRFDQLSSVTVQP